MIKPLNLTSQIVPKGWGHEVIICNNEEFCGKELHVKTGHQFSMHFHKEKREVFRLRQGRAELTTIDLRNALRNVIELKSGDIVEIPRMLPHSIKALENVIIDEYSTRHEDDDSYRVMPGSGQNKEKEG